MQTGKPKRRDSKWLVRIGEEYAIRFTAQRLPDDPVRLLGSIARGAQIGALAAKADGSYVQINGDHVTPLGRSQVHRAVTEARAAQQASPRRARTTFSPAPVVTVRRRRAFAPAAKAETRQVNTTTDK